MRVAFIGLGRMGLPMARRLLGAGHQLVVYNRTAERADSLLAQGARLARSPREAALEVDAAVTMMADDASSRAVWLGPEGVLGGSAGTGALAIECSTLSHEWVRELALGAQRAGWHYVDAPVTGLPQDAAQGSLTLLVGASAPDLARARPLLQVLGDRVLHFGEVGNGTVYKLLVNLIGAVQIGSAAEGLALAERAGLDLAQVVEAIASGQAASPQVVRNTRRMLPGNAPQEVLFTTALRLKDVECALRLARALDVRAAFGEVAAQALRRTCALGLGAANESAVFESARTPGEPGG